MPELLRSRAWVSVLSVPLLIATVLEAQQKPELGAGSAAASDAHCQGSEVAPSRLICFTTTSGTWMSLDLSPDGRTIVFDLLGDLYTLPIAGGVARPLTSGSAWDGQPQFSPDGRTIAFISDRSGIGNVWLVDRDGQNARQLSDVHINVNDSPVSSPAWSPDGRTIVVSQRWGVDKQAQFQWDSTGGEARRIRPALDAVQPSTWVLAAYEVASGRWRWIVDPNEATIRPTLGAVVAPDGKSLYAATQLYPMDYAGGINFWRIDRITLATGARVPEMGQALARSGIRPSVSHDGRWLAYLSPSGSRYGLRMRNLQSQEEQWHAAEKVDAPPASGDIAAGISQLDLSPGYAFAPDDKALLVSHGGKIHRIDLVTGRSRVIPFEVRVVRELARMTVHQFAVPDSAIPIRSVMQPALSPDGGRVAFSALGRLWVMRLPPGGAGEQPWRLTTDSLAEGYPAWSPDGRWIAYSAWQEGVGGMVRRVRVQETPADVPDPSERLSRDTAAYSGVAIVPDGAHVVALRTELSPERRARPFTVLDASSQSRELDSTYLVMLPAEGGPPARIRHLPLRFVGPDATSRIPSEQVYFTNDARRVYVGLSSSALDGSDRRADIVVRDSSLSIGIENDITGVIAPDGRRALLTHYHTLWEATGPTVPSDTLDLHEAARRVPGDRKGAARRWDRALAPWISWSRDGTRVVFVQGATLFVGTVADSGWSTFSRVGVPLALAADRPRGTLVLRGARLLTMSGSPGTRPSVTPRGDLVVQDNRIVAVGPVGTIALPAGATIMRVDGKTILPGYVDVHDHFFPPFGVYAGQLWGALVRLAHGVTALRDPGEVHMQFGDIHRLRDLERNGDLIGPRLFTAGVYHVKSPAPIRQLAEAMAIVHPNADYFATETFKEYSNDPWPSRRLIAAAAGRAGLNATIHGDQLRAVMDGFSGVEHSLGVPVYDDVLTLIAKSGVTLTNTFGVTAAGFGSVLSSGDEPWAARSMRRFVPPSAREFMTKSWMGGVALLGRPEADRLKGLFSSAAGIAAKGGRVGVGMHGNIPGIGFHYEMWFHALGGMPPYEVLRSATSVSAAAIGHAYDLGTLEVGKLADLQILDENPLTDIHHTLSIRMVMKNGRLYEVDDLTEIWPRRRPLEGIYLYDDTTPTSTASESAPTGPR